MEAESQVPGLQSRPGTSVTNNSPTPILFLINHCAPLPSWALARDRPSLNRGHSRFSD
jgi:hypothetical protein